MGLSPDLCSFLCFLALVCAFIYAKRKEIEFRFPMLLVRTRRGKKAISTFVKKHRNIASILIAFSSLLSLPLMLYACYEILKSTYEILSGTREIGAMLVLPAPVREFELKPGFLLSPWYYWVIGVAIVAIPHELAHAIVLRALKMRVKSIGVFFLFFLPGAFVEPDEKELKRAKLKQKLAVYGAGSLANLTLALLCFTLMKLVLHTFYEPSGLIYSGVIAGSPAARVNLSGAILSVNGVEINQVSDLAELLAKIKPGSEITIKTTSGIFNLTTARRNDTNASFIGIAGPFSTRYVVKRFAKSYATSIFSLYKLLSWLAFLSFGVGVFNMLPIKFLDGGELFEALVSRFSSKCKDLANLISVLFLILLVINLGGGRLLR